MSTRCTLRRGEKEGKKGPIEREASLEGGEREEKEKDNRRALTCSRRTERKEGEREGDRGE